MRCIRMKTGLGGRRNRRVRGKGGGGYSCRCGYVRARDREDSEADGAGYGQVTLGQVVDVVGGGGDGGRKCR